MNEQRISSLTPIGDVLARVAALAQPVAPREVALADAEGRVLAEDVVVTAPWPATPVALHRMDGRCAPSRWRMPDLMRRFSLEPAPDVGRCRETRCRAERMRCCRRTPWRTREVHAAATAGDGVLAAGRGCGARRSRCARAGERLRAADVAALQAVGVSRVRVREPRVRVVAMPGCDAVALAISRGVAAHGANVIFVRALERALADEQTDIVITIGGTGAGAMTPASRCSGAWARLRSMASGSRRAKRPRSARAKGHPVLMLPGRLDAALARVSRRRRCASCGG